MMRLFANPYGTRNNGHTMITKDKKRRASKHKRNVGKRLNKKKREQLRMQKKASSPGVPPNTCPYIDQVQTMIADLQHAYERLRERGEHNPVVDEIATLANDTLEYIRKNNETLRDNSAYWYEQYKQTL